MTQDLSSLNLDELKPAVRFAFIAFTQAAIRMSDEGLTSEQFMELAKGCWDTMLLNDKDYLSMLLAESMRREVEKIMEKYE